MYLFVEKYSYLFFLFGSFYQSVPNFLIKTDTITKISKFSILFAKKDWVIDAYLQKTWHNS